MHYFLFLYVAAVLTSLDRIQGTIAESPGVASSKHCIKLQHTLSDGDELCMPLLNYGTGSSTSRRSDITELTKTWLNPVHGSGVDTAYVYRDQKQVGVGMASSGRSREDIFLTTKIPCTGYDEGKQVIRENHDQLKLPFVELVLVHNRNNCTHDSVNGLERLNGTWHALVEDAQRMGTRALGVSNFDVGDLRDLESLGWKVKPAVNQILMHIGCMPSPSLKSYSKRHGIVLESYSPLGKGAVLKHPIVQRLARKYERTPAQVSLQYLIQQGYTVAFTTSKVKYMRDNLAVLSEKEFRLSNADISLLDGIVIPCHSQEAKAAEIF